MIWQKFIKEPLSEEELKQVFSIDDDILSYEFEYLMAKRISDNYKNLLTKPNLSFVNPDLVEKEFLEIVEKELEN